MIKKNGADCEACRLPQQICQRMNSGLADKLEFKADWFVKQSNDYKFR